MNPKNLPSVLKVLTNKRSNKKIIKSKIIPNEYNMTVLHNTNIDIPEFFGLTAIGATYDYVTTPIEVFSHFITLENKRKINILNIEKSKQILTDAMETNSEVSFIKYKRKIEDCVVLPRDTGNIINNFIEFLADNEKVFVKNNGIWTIRYKEEFIQVKDSKGLNYIQYLLQNPNKHIGLAELYHAVNGGDLPTLESIIDGHTIDKNQVREEILNNISLLNKKLDVLDQNYDIADFENNEEKMIKIDKERESIKAEIKFLNDKKYYAPKNISHERKKISNLIRKSISDFYTQIITLEKLYMHLHDSIKVENGYKYIDQNLSSWLTDF